MEVDGIFDGDCDNGTGVDGPGGGKAGETGNCLDCHEATKACNGRVFALLKTMELLVGEDRKCHRVNDLLISLAVYEMLIGCLIAVGVGFIFEYVDKPMQEFFSIVLRGAAKTGICSVAILDVYVFVDRSYVLLVLLTIV